MKVSNLVTIGAKDQKIVLKEDYSSKQTVQKTSLYVNRIIYSVDSFEKVALDASTKTFTITRVSNITRFKESGYYALFRMGDCILYRTAGTLFITDVDMLTIKCKITNLLDPTHQFRQDRQTGQMNIYDKTSLTALNLFNESNLCIPYGLLVRKNVYTVYNHQTRMIKYYNTYEEMGAIAQVKFNTYRIKNVELISTDNDLFYNVIHRANFLVSAQNSPSACQTVQNICNNRPSNQPLPLFLTGKENFKIHIDLQKQSEFLLFMIKQDPNDNLYKYEIGLYIDDLIKFKKWFKAYFQSTNFII